MTLPALASDPDLIQRAADPAQFVVLACERAKTWLTEAVQQGRIGEINDLRCHAEAVRVYTAQREIGRDAELAASEVVRRAERGMGVAIRRGQEAGEIATLVELRQYAGLVGQHRDDNPVPVRKPAPIDYVSRDELTGNKAGIYHMTDGVTDAQFEEALTEARAEGNLARANVVRKLHRDDNSVPAQAGGGREPFDLSTFSARRARIAELAAQNYSSRQIAKMLGFNADWVRVTAREAGIDVPADAIIGKTRRHDSNRIVRETVSAMEGLAMGVDLVDVAELDPGEIRDWVASLTTSIRVLNRLTKTMKEATR
jgi:hypothetical protein